MFPNLYRDMASGMPDRVTCRQCGASQTVDPAECLRHGWPKCCGATMSLPGFTMTKNAPRSYSLDGPKCPKCGFIFTPDEGYYYDNNRYTSDKCQECGTKFSVEVHHSTSWLCKLVE